MCIKCIIVRFFDTLVSPNSQFGREISVTHQPDTANLHVLIDWGTSNARAWLVDGTGAMRDHHAAPEGILRVQIHDFAAGALG